MSPTQIWRRTAPIASLKVRLVFRYHAAACGVLALVSLSQAHSDTRLWSPRSAGVVRAMALSVH